MLTFSAFAILPRWISLIFYHSYLFVKGSFRPKTLSAPARYFSVLITDYTDYIDYIIFELFLRNLSSRRNVTLAQAGAGISVISDYFFKP
jgi:hypothetical protein